MSSKSTTNGLRRSLRALPIVLGASALIVLGGAAAFDYSDCAFVRQEWLRS